MVFQILLLNTGTIGIVISESEYLFPYWMQQVHGKSHHYSIVSANKQLKTMPGCGLYIIILKYNRNFLEKKNHLH